MSIQLYLFCCRAYGKHAIPTFWLICQLCILSRDCDCYVQLYLHYYETSSDLLLYCVVLVTIFLVYYRSKSRVSVSTIWSWWDLSFCHLLNVFDKNFHFGYFHSYKDYQQHIWTVVVPSYSEFVEQTFKTCVVFHLLGVFHAV